MAVFQLPTMFRPRAEVPFAVLYSPVVLLKRAAAPVAVLLFPVLARSVPAPTPVLKSPVVRALRESTPTAVLNWPSSTLRLRKALCPAPVLKPGNQSCGSVMTACARDGSPKQASRNAARNNG